MALLRSRGETLKKLGSEWSGNSTRNGSPSGAIYGRPVHPERWGRRGLLPLLLRESEEQATAMLLNCSLSDLEKLPARSPPSLSRSKQEESKQLEIPPAHNNMRRVFAYLCQTRGIDPEVVSAFVRKGLLYESASHHNAVFVVEMRKTRSATSTPGGPSPAPIFARHCRAARGNSASTGRGPAQTVRL